MQLRLFVFSTVYKLVIERIRGSWESFMYPVVMCMVGVWPCPLLYVLGRYFAMTAMGLTMFHPVQELSHITGDSNKQKLG